MNRRVIGLAVAGLAAGAIMAVLSLRAPNDFVSAGTPIVSGKALVGGPFKLIDQNGKPTTEKDFLGRYMLVFFGFTNCPDICPAGLQVMTTALDQLGDSAKDVTPVFITVDAERDTPEKLALYAKSFHPRLVALTGSDEEVKAAAKAYRVYFEKVPDGSNPANYSFDHSSIFYLMDKDGTLLAPIPYTTDPAQLATAIRTALPQS